MYELETYSFVQEHAIITLCVGHYTRPVNLTISGIHPHILENQHSKFQSDLESIGQLVLAC